MAQVNFPALLCRVSVDRSLRVAQWDKLKSCALTCRSRLNVLFFNAFICNIMNECNEGVNLTALVLTHMKVCHHKTTKSISTLSFLLSFSSAEVKGHKAQLTQGRSTTSDGTNTFTLTFWFHMFRCRQTITTCRKCVKMTSSCLCLYNDLTFVQ